MDRFEIYDVAAGKGRLGICPMPGRHGNFERDLAQMLSWRPVLVLTMTTAQELTKAGAERLSEPLRSIGCAWHFLPIEDFGAPSGDTAVRWPEVSDQARAALASGANVLAHCWGGQGRSGMAAMRLLVELGEDPKLALSRIRAVRANAVETDEQFNWAAHSITK